MVEKAWRPRPFLAYPIVAALLMLEFHSVRVTLCLLIPALAGVMGAGR